MRCAPACPRAHAWSRTAARFSARRGLIAESDAERVADALARAGLPTEIAALGLGDGTAMSDHELALLKPQLDAGAASMIGGEGGEWKGGGMV